MRRNELQSQSGGHPNDERFASYALHGPDLDPDDVTARTGIAPDSAWHRGAPKPRTGRPHERGYWAIDSGLSASDEFHAHMDALLERLRPAWQVFLELGDRYEAAVDVAIYLHEAQGPLVQVLPDVCADLAQLQATLAFDLYAIPDDVE